MEIHDLLHEFETDSKLLNYLTVTGPNNCAIVSKLNRDIIAAIEVLKNELSRCVLDRVQSKPTGEEK